MSTAPLPNRIARYHDLALTPYQGESAGQPHPVAALNPTDRIQQLNYEKDFRIAFFRLMDSYNNKISIIGTTAYYRPAYNRADKRHPAVAMDGRSVRSREISMPLKARGWPPETMCHVIVT